MSTIHMPRLGALIAAALLGLSVASCGGGGLGSGGTGAPMSQTSGTVTGFASVIVDGTEYQDDEVTPKAEREPGVESVAEAKLGQFVELEFEQKGEHLQARAIRLDAAVVGVLSAVSPSAGGGTIELMGQKVFENTSADAGPVTLYAGVEGLSALNVGDAVEVHGVPRWNTAESRYEVQATRIEKLSSVPAVLRVAGVVSSLEASGPGKRFSLGGLTVAYDAAKLLPDGRALSNGSRVVVWAAQPPSNGVLSATGVRTVLRNTGVAALPARLGGRVGRLDTVLKRFDLAGVTVNYTGAQFVPPDRAVAEGAYIRAEGVYGNDGVLNASKIKVFHPKAGGSDKEWTVKGRINAFTSLASFRVRTVEIDASGLKELENCGTQPLAKDRVVEVEGRAVSRGLLGSVLYATRLSCKN